MRAGITVTWVAFVLAVSALGCEKGTSQTLPTELEVAAAAVKTKVGNVEQDFSGSSFPISEANGETTTLHSFLAKGQSGVARVNALLVYKTHKGTTDASGDAAPPEATDDCKTLVYECDPKRPCVYGVDLVSMTWVQTYNDGSSFSGSLPNHPADDQYAVYFPKSYVCTNGRDFSIHVEGRVIDGIGTRFEGLTGGTWTVDAITSTYLTEGKFNASLTY